MPAVQFLRVTGNPPERRLEIVGHRVGERLQFLVSRPQQLLDLRAAIDLVFEFLVFGAQLGGSAGDPLSRSSNARLRSLMSVIAPNHADRLRAPS